MQKVPIEFLSAVLQVFTINPKGLNVNRPNDSNGHDPERVEYVSINWIQPLRGWPQ